MYLGRRGTGGTYSLVPAGRCGALCPSAPIPEPAAGRRSFPIPVSCHHLPGPHSPVPPRTQHRSQPRVRGSGSLDQSISPAQEDIPAHLEQSILPYPCLHPTLPWEGVPSAGLCRWATGLYTSWKCFLHQVFMALPQPPPPPSYVARPLPTAHCPCLGTAGGLRV